MSVDLEAIVHKLNQLQDNQDNLSWEAGKLVTEAFNGSSKDLQKLVAHPDVHFTHSSLREWEALYKAYPDLTGRPLPRHHYLILATRVHTPIEREALELEALSGKWDPAQLKKSIRDHKLAKKQAEKSRYGFDLCVTNLWYFNSADPRFGKSDFKGRIAGQIIANALHYYSKPEDYIVDTFAGSGTLGDVIDKLQCFHDRRYKMYDLHPVDERIQRNDILNGIPEATESVDYVFLDPPYGSVSQGYYSGEDSDFAEMTHEEFCYHLKLVIRESHRILKIGGRVSIILEPYLTQSSFLDFPGEARIAFLEQGFEQIGKVYVANQTMRGGLSTAHLVQESKQKGFMLSDCRELLTFRKV